MTMRSRRDPLSSTHSPQFSDSIYDRCHWLYALCREYVFEDHTRKIASALFPSGDPAEGTQILELGCGPGLYACQFARDFPQVTTTGIDLSRRLIRRARTRARNLQLQNCRFFVGDAQALKELSHSVDAVIVSRLFLIIPNKEAVLAEIFRILRPGGRCFIAEPTSGFASRLPLSAMWLLARVTSGSCEKLLEPHPVEVMRPTDFLKLVEGAPWASVNVLHDEWYQFAVCQKSEAQGNEQSWSLA